MSKLLTGVCIWASICSLEMEHRLVSHFVEGLTGDFLEDIRAVLVEKDNKPLWSPRTLGEVTDETDPGPDIQTINEGIRYLVKDRS